MERAAASERPLKVLWISHGSTLQGAERCLLEAVCWTRASISSTVVVPNPGPLKEELERSGVRTLVIRHPWWLAEFSRGALTSFRKCLRAVARISWAILRERPDVVVTNSLVCPSGAIAAWVMRVPHVWYAHEFVEEDHGWHFSFGAGRSLKFVGDRSERVIANSEAVKRKLASHIPAGKITRLYFPPAVPESDAGSVVRKPGFRIGILGRKAPSKGVELGVRALGELRRAGISAELYLIGPDHQGHEVELRHLAHTLGVSGSVHFVAPQPLTTGLYSDLDVVAVCSRSEAYGRVTVEAMLLGKAVIASNSGANLELIRDGETGLQFEAGSVPSLAAGLRRLHDDPALRSRLAGNARRFARTTFNQAEYVDALTRLFATAARRDTLTDPLPP